MLDLIVQYKQYLILGTKITLIVSLSSIVLGFVIGLILAIIRVGNNKILSWMAGRYVDFIRGTPVLVQIAMVYYGLPLMGVHFPDVMLFGVTLNRLSCGILALGLNSAAYVCEIIRGGILSVDKGQSEAALSLGYKKSEVMRLFVLPLALKNMLPALGNEFIVMIKTSSQVSVMGLADLMYVADVIRGNSFQAFMPLVIVAIIYLCITYMMAVLLRAVERHFRAIGE